MAIPPPPSGFKLDNTGDVPPPPSGFTLDQPEQKKKGLIGKGWDFLQKPEQMSRQGLQQIAGMIPEGKITGNLPMDVLRGTPRIAANTMAEAAPGFVSRGALLTAGAMPVAKGICAAG